MKILTFACLAAVTSGAIAEELDVRSRPASDEFLLTVTTAIVELQPGDDDFVRVNYQCATETMNEPSDGLRVVKKAGAVPSLRRSSDKIVLRFNDEGGDCWMRVTAPATLATRIRIDGAGRIEVRDWEASLTAWSAAGDVEVWNQSGPFSLTAMSGDATVEYTASELSTDSAVTAANGTVTVALPGNPPAAIRASARWGDIRTDLDVDFVDEPGPKRIWSVTELNGGGPVITLRNLNEDIEVRAALCRDEDDC